MAKKKINLTPQQIDSIAECSGLGLTWEETARVLGISDDTLRRRRKDAGRENTAIEAAYETGKARAKFDVSKACLDLAKKGHPDMVRFWLKCRAGWTETQRHEHQGRVTLEELITKSIETEKNSKDE